VWFGLQILEKEFASCFGLEFFDDWAIAGQEQGGGREAAGKPTASVTGAAVSF
jgi:hypothetical protein